MLRRQQGVQRADAGVANSCLYLVLPDHQVANLLHGEAARRTLAGAAGLYRPVFRDPFLPAAVQHRRVVVTELAQQPPDPGCPPGIRGAVGYDARGIADTETTHR